MHGNPDRPARRPPPAPREGAPSLKHRYETFGGIISSESPPFLAFVDRQFMRELGHRESELWRGADERIGLLSAPTEVHLAATNACPRRCRHCYMDSGDRAEREMDAPTFRRALGVLADMGVFHIALGGGEALTRGELFELAAHVRELGMVPNLTVSGSLMTPEIAKRMRVFGQVNVSIDGAGSAFGAFRNEAHFAAADAAIGMLVGAGVSTGINCVVGKRNFDALDELFDYGCRKGVSELEFLRLKPVGRGADLYAAERTTHEQNVALGPRLTDLSERTGLGAKVDCSFVPMLCYHQPPLELLEATGTYGCEAANVLLGIRSDGAVAGCSFLPAEGPPLAELPARWIEDAHFARLRTWPERAVEPCRSCGYLSLCKGGCHAVAAHVTGSLDAPDPDCPWVVEHSRTGGGKQRTSHRDRGGGASS